MKCNCQNTQVVLYHHEYLIKGKKIEFDQERRVCSDCGSLVYDEKLDDIASKEAIRIYNINYGITKEEIKKIRQNYGLSLELFAKIIGCAKKTLISYEKGTSIPNDNYLIILKTLQKNPSLLKDMIESNQERFTIEEMDKIKNKLHHLYGNHFLTINFLEENEPSSYNGYTKFSFKKFKDVVLYLTRKTIGKTKLMKELFYTDFLYYKNYGSSLTGLTYVKLPHGPVPDNYETLLEILNDNDFVEITSIIKGNYEENSIAGKNKDYDLSLEEKKLIDEIINYFADYTGSQISDYSHQEKAWQESKLNQFINYDYAFDIDRKKNT